MTAKQLPFNHGLATDNCQTPVDWSSVDHQQKLAVNCQPPGLNRPTEVAGYLKQKKTKLLSLTGVDSFHAKEISLAKSEGIGGKRWRTGGNRGETGENERWQSEHSLEVKQGAEWGKMRGRKGQRKLGSYLFVSPPHPPPPPNEQVGAAQIKYATSPCFPVFSHFPLFFHANYLPFPIFPLFSMPVPKVFHAP